MVLLGRTPLEDEPAWAAGVAEEPALMKAAVAAGVGDPATIRYAAAGSGPPAEPAAEPATEPARTQDGAVLMVDGSFAPLPVTARTFYFVDLASIRLSAVHPVRVRRPRSSIPAWLPMPSTMPMIELH